VPLNTENHASRHPSRLWLKALNYTAAALEDKWAMSEDESERVTMPTPWGTTYTLEQMLEHAIVHILRHRRQIERLIDNPI